MKESRIESALIKAIKAKGWKTYKLLAHRGAPDRLILPIGGDAFFVECKAPGLLPRPEQLREHIRLREIGYNVYVLDQLSRITEVLDEPTRKHSTYKLNL